ncbi:hypothetical protein B0H16DRAFT_1767284 [Mycena metata]|uniref:F-box domain-containing protein n=1 Tax=Mycena metata TaxID=1033252 RepID=A0AAD7I3X5_9AGAR|nr:hypothetical protein B0H16DRAFT_1767284 [Mycena metata]
MKLKLEVQPLHATMPGHLVSEEAATENDPQDPILYPVLTLPNEIVSEIFISFLPPYPECPPTFALSTPELWRAMAFDFDYFKFQPNHRAWGGLVKTWLDRSQACALSLQIVSTVKYDYGAIKYDDGELYAILELMEAAAAHCARWEYLKFHLAQASRIHMFKLDGSRPLLRHLDMRLEYDSRGRSDVSGFRDTPFLCTAVLNGNVIARGIILPWMQLASLVLQRIRPSRCSHILKQAPNLIHCELDLVHDDTFLSEVALPQLEALIFNYQREFAFEIQYLHCFVVPSLRRLQILELFLGPSPFNVLESFISRSGHQLQSILITRRSQVPKDAYYEAFPSIELSFEDVPAVQATGCVSRTS